MPVDWFSGSIADAVAKSKEQNSIFVVFIEGKEDAAESTEKLNTFLADDRISSKLNTPQFVAIRFMSESPEFLMFCQCYNQAPVPSIFFIGQGGLPLFIATDILASVDELEGEISNLLKASDKSEHTTVGTSQATERTAETAAQQKNLHADTIVKPSSTNSIRIAAGGEDVGAAKQDDETAKENLLGSSPVENMPSTSATARSALQATELLQVESLKSPTESSASLAENSKVTVPPHTAKSDKAASSDALNEERQHQLELKRLQESLRLEKLAEQLERERIRAQFAGDRREIAQRSLAQQPDSAASSKPTQSASSIKLNADQTRLQLRFPDGNNVTKIYEAVELFSTVRDFVRSELASSSSAAHEFILATSYPRYEFKHSDDAKSLLDLKLAPSAVLLVILKDVAPTVARTGGIYAFVSSLIWAMITPAVTIWDYFRKLAVTQGEQQQEADDMLSIQADAARRRNLSMYLRPTSDSGQDQLPDRNTQTARRLPAYRSGSNIHRLRDPSKDDSDENATYNGNSTQQQ